MSPAELGRLLREADPLHGQQLRLTVTADELRERAVNAAFARMDSQLYAWLHGLWRRWR